MIEMIRDIDQRNLGLDLKATRKDLIDIIKIKEDTHQMKEKRVGVKQSLRRENLKLKMRMKKLILSKNKRSLYKSK